MLGQNSWYPHPALRVAPGLVKRLKNVRLKASRCFFPSKEVSPKTIVLGSKQDAEYTP